MCCEAQLWFCGQEFEIVIRHNYLNVGKYDKIMPSYKPSWSKAKPGAQFNFDNSFMASGETILGSEFRVAKS